MSEYKSPRQRDAEASLTTAQAEQTKVAAQAARVELAAAAAATETRKLAEQAKQQRLREQMDTQADEAKARAAERKKRRADSAADDGTTFKKAVLAFVILSMSAAMPAQFSYFLGLHKPGEQGGIAWLMAPLPLVAELGAWVSVYGTAWARRKGLPLAPFWGLTALLAGFSAWLNFSHGSADYGQVAGWALALASVAGPGIWELKEALEGQAAVDSRSRQQRADDKKAAKAKAVADAKRAQHDAKRAELDAEVWTRYQQILTAHPLDSVERERAYAQAWWDVHRAPLGVTAETYRVSLEAESTLAELIDPEGSRSVYREIDRLLFNPIRDGGDDGGQALAGAVPNGPQAGPSRAATALGGKGKEPSAAGRQATPGKPLDPEHVKAVRDLAELFASANRTISVSDVKKLIGGGRTEYLVRLRDAATASE